MAKKTKEDATPAVEDPQPAAAADPHVAGGESRPTKPERQKSPLHDPIKVLQRVLGVGCVVAKRHVLQLTEAERAQIVERYAAPEAHDAIRQLVHVAELRAKKAKTTDDTGSNSDGPQ